MPIFGGGDDKSSKSGMDDVRQAVSTILDRLKVLESKVAVLTERYETFSKEQSNTSSQVSELRKRANEVLADAEAKVETLVLEYSKIKSSIAALERLEADLPKNSELAELRKRLEMLEQKID